MQRNSAAASRYAPGYDQKLKPKKLPINLLRKAQREARYNNNKLKSQTPRKARKRKPDFERSEHEALLLATETELRKILAESELLSDIPYDCTPQELLGEIAIAEGHATTVYVQRDGLSTLTIVLPQPQPTIANLKRAIESTARVQLKRELRQRHEERLERRQRPQQRNDEVTATIGDDDEDDNDVVVVNKEHNSEDCRQRRQNMILETERHTHSTGELVYSTARSGHHHRPNVSWRFLWRAYALFNVDTNLPLADDTNGRRLLSECGIENATTLKFCNREKYFARKRQT